MATSAPSESAGVSESKAESGGVHAREGTREGSEADAATAVSTDVVSRSDASAAFTDTDPSTKRAESEDQRLPPRCSLFTAFVGACCCKDEPLSSWLKKRLP